MKKHPINVHSHGATLYISDQHIAYAIPKNIANKYVISFDRFKKTISKALVNIEDFFDNLDKKYTKAGALLKGLRLRENLSQDAFSEKIDVSQANLSAMENGRRPIGKIIAKRIEKIFGTNYRYFLE